MWRALSGLLSRPSTASSGTPLTLDQIATLDGSSRLALQPHMQLVAMDYAADELVLELHDRQKRETSEAGLERDSGPGTPARLPKMRRKPTWVAAHRMDLTVYFRRLRAGGVFYACGNPARIAAGRSAGCGIQGIANSGSAPSAAGARVVCQLGRTGLDLRARSRFDSLRRGMREWGRLWIWGRMLAGVFSRWPYARRAPAAADPALLGLAVYAGRVGQAHSPGARYPVLH